jgi:hypothetical protein
MCTTLTRPAFDDVVQPRQPRHRIGLRHEPLPGAGQVLALRRGEAFDVVLIPPSRAARNTDRPDTRYPVPPPAADEVASRLPRSRRVQPCMPSAPVEVAHSVVDADRLDAEFFEVRAVAVALPVRGQAVGDRKPGHVSSS